MMRKACYAILAALVLMLLMISSAFAADSHYTVYGIIGDTVTVEHKDLTHLIDESLTREDFDVTYQPGYGYEHTITFEGDQVTLSPTAQMSYPIPCYAHYTHRQTGVETVFPFTVKVCQAAFSVSGLDQDSFLLAADQTKRMYISINRTAPPIMKLTVADPDIIEVTATYLTDTEWYVVVRPVKTGKTSFEMAFIGKRVTVEVEVISPPTEIRVNANAFECYIGDTVDLGTELIGGLPEHLSYTLIEVPNLHSASASLDKDLRTFSASEPGWYQITLKTYNGLNEVVNIYVYDRESCAYLLVEGIVNENTQSDAVRAYTRNMERLYLPIRVTQGSEIASYEGMTLTTTGTGTAAVTVYNPDGTTLTESFEVLPKPTELLLPLGENITLEVGDTLDLWVDFDRGDADCTMTLRQENFTSPGNQNSLLQTGKHRFLAQVPGATYVDIRTAIGLSATCRVEVLDNEKALYIDAPEMLGINHTYQLRVMDGTGREFPALFELTSRTSSVTLSLTGTITGLEQGEVKLCARLKDGRTLYHTLLVTHLPTWLFYPDLVLRLDESGHDIDYIRSDSGNLSSRDVNITYEDERIASGAARIIPHKVGQTKVTLTSKTTGAQTTFLLTVLPKMSQYALDSAFIEIPEGFKMALPQPVDASGNPIKMRWWITHEYPGEGNPEKNAFRIGDNGTTIECLWAKGVCEVMGATEDDKSVVLTVQGYKLADAIVLEQEEYLVEVGSTVLVKALPATLPTSDRVGEIMWLLEDDTVCIFPDNAAGQTSVSVQGVKPGITSIAGITLSGEFAAATIRVVESLSTLGDVNEDGRVDTEDVALLSQYMAGWEVSLNLDNADTSQDGQVTMKDLNLLVRYCGGETNLF